LPSESICERRNRRAPAEQRVHRIVLLASVKPAAGTAADLPVYPSLDAEAESAPRWTA